MNLQFVALVATALLQLYGTIQAIDNGLGLTPPMGWRSWNCYHGDVNQTKMTSIMDRMTERTRQVDGKNMSLLDLGYANVGLDDNWQACGKGVHGSFHDAKGNPIINLERFPDMKAMTTYGHNKGLRVGWYMNNCICNEHEFKTPQEIATHMEGSAKAVADYGFDGVKLDGCGQFRNLTWWAALLNKTGRPILIENCHWGGTVPGQTTGDGPCSGTTTPSDCPYNFFRTSGDISNNWGSMTRNLMSTTAYQGTPPLARPGTWAYPDMLEVGRMANYFEDRTHFGAWCIVSAPLILGYDMNTQSNTDKIWDIISNQEAIAINQAWYGHPGRLAATMPAKNSSKPGKGMFLWAEKCATADPTEHGFSYDGTKHAIMKENMCAQVSKDSAQGGGPLIEMVPCDGSTAQQFVYHPDSSTFENTAAGKCLDIFNSKGPVVQVYRCNGGKNQAMNVTKDATIQSECGLCLSEKQGEPQPPSGSNEIMIWAKDLGPNGNAVLVINGGAENQTVTFDIVSDAKLPKTENVRDVWNHKDLPKMSGTKFTTDILASHDSRMYRFY